MPREYIYYILKQLVDDEQLAKDIEESLWNISINFNTDYNQLCYDSIYNLSVNFEDTIDDINNEKINFVSSLYNNERIAKKSFIARVTFKPEASKGVYKCFKCKGDEFIIWRVQVRSADEPMTTFRLCIKCGARGKE